MRSGAGWAIIVPRDHSNLSRMPWGGFITCGRTDEPRHTSATRAFIRQAAGAGRMWRTAHGPPAGAHAAAERSTAAAGRGRYAQGTGEKLQRGPSDDFEARGLARCLAWWLRQWIDPAPRKSRNFPRIKADAGRHPLYRTARIDSFRSFDEASFVEQFARRRV